MAGFQSYYLRAQMLRHILQGNVPGTAYPQPTVYMALFLSTVAEDGIGTELAGAGYKRQRVFFSVPADGQSAATNNAVVSFPKPTDVWGTVTHFGLLDAEAGGNLLYAAPLSAPLFLDASSAPLSFDIGSVTVAEVTT